MNSVDNYEYELKILGSKNSLSTVFNRFSNSVRVLRDRSYVFDTLYIDTPDNLLLSQGYSLRFRPQQGTFKSRIEAKEIEGSIGGVSKRTEIGVTENKDINLLYNDIKDVLNLHWPNFEDLSTVFKTSVNRREVTGLITIGGKTLVLEAALDSIEYIRGDSIIGVEDEMEVEIKGGFSIDPIEVFEYSKRTWTIGADVLYTTKSKAARARELF